MITWFQQALAEARPLTDLFAFLLGAAWGSFLNVVIWRLPRRESLVFPGSRCPSCGAAIGWHDNIPVLSWFLLRGRCRRCRGPISPRYPFVEAVCGALVLALFLRQPELLTAQGATLAREVVLLAGRSAFALSMVALFFIDYDHKILPDRITIPGIAAGLAVSAIDPGTGWRDALLGATLGALLPLLLYTVWLVLRGMEGLGLGDVKMLAMIGAFLGWEGVLLTLLLASVAGGIAGILLVLVGRRSLQAEIPFGTFLAVAALATAMAGSRIVAAYWDLSERLASWLTGP